MLAAVRAAVDAGELAVSVPDSAVVERPKSREHGDYATNVALRLAKPAGRPPREVAELIAARLREHPGIARVDVAGPGFLNITLAKDALAGLVRTVVEAGPAYGRGEVNAGQPPQPGVRLGQPDRPAAPGARPVGRGRRLAGPAAGGQRRRGDPGVLLQRRRRPDRPVRRGRWWRPRPGSRPRRTATRATTSSRSPRRWSPPTPGCWTSRRRSGSEVFRIEGVELMLAEIKRSLADFGVEFDVYFSERTLHANGEIERGGRPGCGSRATSTRPTARSGCAPPTSATTRTGCWSARTAGRPTSPPTAPTTWTSGDGARTGRRSCSAPTTTATSAGCGRSRRCFGDDPDQTVEILIGQLVNAARRRG